MTQPTDHSSDIRAASVARSETEIWSIAKALKIGLPAFMSEFRTAMAAMTVHRMGLNPSTSRNGILAPWTMITDLIRPKRLASVGWNRIATIVPRLVIAKTPL